MRRELQRYESGDQIDECCALSGEKLVPAFWLVLEEVEKYRAMKEELRRKQAPAAGSLINEETKNELIKRCRQQARASFIKKLATSQSDSP